MWSRQISCFLAIYNPKKRWGKSIPSRGTLKKELDDKFQNKVWKASKYSHFIICSMVDLPQRLGRRTRSTLPCMRLSTISSISFVLSTRKRPKSFRNSGKKEEHIAKDRHCNPACLLLEYE